MANYLEKNHGQEVRIACVVEPDISKVKILREREITVYKDIFSLPKDNLSSVGVVVDCSTKGEGRANKIKYQQLGLPAIFQNGEEIGIADLYYPEICNFSSMPPYVRIPCCSAMSVARILLAIHRSELATVKRVSGYHNKTSNDSRMITVNYVSGEEIRRLFNVDARMNRIYLRGEPLNHEYVYAGNVEILLSKHIAEDDFKKALSEEDNLKVANQDIDTVSLARTPDTIVIHESIEVEDNLIRLGFISFPPEIDFPANLQAIREYDNVTSRRLR